ncbi:hypothetical protein TYRP_020593 [Tyrophagus putrescentiae]|nr:hypothetical protein TYRP_020593 [Tyrophagus putrescentiae]
MQMSCLSFSGVSVSVADEEEGTLVVPLLYTYMVRLRMLLSKLLHFEHGPAVHQHQMAKTGKGSRLLHHLLHPLQLINGHHGKLGLVGDETGHIRSQCIIDWDHDERMFVGAVLRQDVLGAVRRVDAHLGVVRLKTELKKAIGEGLLSL